MKAQVRLPKITIEVEGASQKDTFEAVAGACEVFGEKCCGLCGSESIRPAIRNVTSGKKNFTFYEYRCDACHARLVLGQSGDKVTLFPIRKLTDDGRPASGELKDQGTFGKHRGWHKPVFSTKDE